MDDGNYSSDSEDYGYNDEDELELELEQAREDENEDDLEHNLTTNDTLITRLQNDLDKLYDEFMDNNMTVSDFQTEIILTQQKITTLRIDTIIEYLNIEERKKLTAEINRILAEGSKFRFPENVLNLANREQLQMKLSTLEGSLRGKVDDIIEEYRILIKQRQEDSGPVISKGKLLGKVDDVSIEEIKWFLIRIPENDEEAKLIVDFYMNSISNMTMEKSIRVFGSSEIANNIYSDLNNYLDDNLNYPNFMYLQQFMPLLISLIDTDHERIMEVIRELEEKELDLLKKKIKKNNINSDKVNDDFRIIEGNISKIELEKFMNENNIDDPDKAETAYSRKLLEKYKKALPPPRRDLNVAQEFLMKRSGIIPVRNAPKINEKLGDEYYLNKFEEAVDRRSMDTKYKPNLGKLRIILSKIPRQALINCINKMGYGVSNSYIQSLRNNRIRILKFRENPESFDKLALSLNRSLDELNLSRDKKEDIVNFVLQNNGGEQDPDKPNFLVKDPKRTVLNQRNININSKMIMVQINPSDGRNLNIPKGLTPLDDGSANPEAVKEFFQNLKKYNGELVVKADNAVFKDLVESQYTDINDALNKTNVFGYFIITGRGLSQLTKVVDSDKFRLQLMSWKSKTEKGDYGVSFQRLPLNSRLDGTHNFKLNGKEYKIIVDQPPTTTAYAWIITEPISGVRIVVKDFEQYLKMLLDLFVLRLESAKRSSVEVLNKKIKSISDYLGIFGPDNKRDRIIAPSSVKEVQFRIIAKQQLIISVLKNIVDNVSIDEIIKCVGELERVAASSVENVINKKSKYLYLMEEIDYIIRLYPNVIGLMIQGKILPTDVINIKNNFYDMLDNRELVNKTETYSEIIKWVPPMPTIDGDFRVRIVNESKNDLPNITLIDWGSVKNLDITLLEKKAIIQESYTYLKWSTNIKKALSAVNRGADKNNVLNYLKTSKIRLYNSGRISIQNRIKTTKILSKKIGECRKLGFSIQNSDDNIMSQRIELVVFNLASNTLDYSNVISNMVKDNTKTFCELLIPNNTILVGEIARNYILVPEIVKGKSEQEVLAYASIPVLNAIRSLQTNMLDIISEQLKLDIKGNKYIVKQLKLKNIIVKQFIRRKQERLAQEAFAILNGKLDYKNVEQINVQEDDKLSENELMLDTNHNLMKWRNSVYVEPLVSKKIPKNTFYEITPLQNKIGFWIGGNFPDNVIPYRYIDPKDNILRSYLTDLSYNIGKVRVVEYLSNDVNQKGTRLENEILGDIQNILSLRFNLQDKFKKDELQNICLAMGYGPNQLSSFVPGNNEIVPWKILRNGDHVILSLSDYIKKLRESGIEINNYYSVDINQLDAINKQYNTDLSLSDTKGIWNLDSIIQDYFKYIRLHDYDLDESVMYKRCILDNIEIDKPLEIVKQYNKKELQLMSLKQYKTHIIKQSKKNKKEIPSDSEITTNYFNIKNKQVDIANNIKPYYILAGKLYNVKHNVSLSFPVPIEYSGQYPVYTKSQLNDLGNLLISGILSPWLINDVKIEYGNTPTILSKGNTVNINGKDVYGNKVLDKLGIINDILDDIYYVKYDNNVIGEFKKSNLTPMLVRDITGFTGSPPWFIKDVNVKTAMDYIKSSDFKKLGDSEKSNQIALIVRDFGTFGEDLKISKIISELNAQKNILVRILNSDKLNNSQIMKIYEKLGFINPGVLRSKILERHNLLLRGWEELNGGIYKMSNEDKRNDILYYWSGVLGITDANEKVILKKVDESKNKIDSALVYLDSDYWGGDLTKDKISMYNNIAKTLDIPTELVNNKMFVNKIKLRLNDVQNNIKYLNSKIFNDLDHKEKIDVTIRLVNDFNIPIPIPSAKKLYERLSSISIKIGTVSTYYIEQEFVDKYNKTITVKSGVSKNKIIWKPSNWDVCNYFTQTDKNAKILDVVNYIRSEKFINSNNKPEILNKIKINFDLNNNGKKGIIKELENKITPGGVARCGSQFNCMLNNSNICISPNLSINPIETPEQRVQRLIESRNIEDLPSLSKVVREFKDYKKDDDVWNWYPYPKPDKSKNSREYNKWDNDPEVKLWNLKIKDSLKELESLLFNRLRVNSKSFNERKDELTKDLEEFRKRMTSQKINFDYNNNIKNKRVKKDDFIPDISYINNVIVERFLKIFLDNRTIRLTPDAKIFLKDIENNKLAVGQTYTKFKIIKKDFGNRTVNVGKKKFDKYHDVQYLSVADKDINLLDVVKNMSYTHDLRLVDQSDKYESYGYGTLFDYLIHSSNISSYEKGTNAKINIPDVSVTIDVRDILEYMGDSYFQFGEYMFGVISEESNNGVEQSYIKPPCGYTSQVDKSNSYTTYDDETYQGIYVIDDDLHRKGSISTDVARRFSLIIGSDIRYIPPCFSSKPSSRVDRKQMNVITGEDIRSYLVRSGKGFYLSDLTIGDLKSISSENLLYKQQNDQIILEKKYKKALVNIFNNKILGRELEDQVKLASRIFKIDRKILLRIAYLMKDEPTSLGKTAILEKLKIPIRRSDDTVFIKNKMEEVEKRFKEDYNFELSDYLKNPKTTKSTRIIEINKWN